MGDENPIRTLGDYSKPSHEGYRNTIKLSEGNNVVPLRSDTIRLVQNGCSFHELRSKDPNQHLKDFLKLVDSLNLDALGTTFEARVRDYMAAHTEGMESFENAIFKQREEINDRMTEMFEILKELTTSRAPEKVLIREEAKHLVTKNVNSIALIRGEEEKNADDNATPDDSIERPDGSDAKLAIRISTFYEAEDVLVDVVGYVYPVDFLILYIKEDEKRPFILVTPFLTIAKAMIKFDKGTITLRSRKSRMSFRWIPESLCKIGKGIKNDIEPVAPTMTVNRLVLEWEKRIKLY
nr:MAK10-like protein [Tanacetum cinerariifolium]